MNQRPGPAAIAALLRLDRPALVAGIGTLRAAAAELDGRPRWAWTRWRNPNAAADLRQLAAALEQLLAELPPSG